MKVEVSIGEIVDKLSILAIKQQKIHDTTKLVNIQREYLYLHEIVFAELNINMEDYEQLVSINTKLWDIEDVLREMESRKQFDDLFVEYARQVYITNDLRADLKKQINLKYGSTFIEEKSYEKY